MVDSRASFLGIEHVRVELVLGAPGCGKSQYLIGVLRETLAAGVPPESVLVATYTRAARLEILERMGREFGLHENELPWVRTIHSSARRLLGIPREQFFHPTKHLAEFAEESGYTFRLHEPEWDDDNGAPVLAGEWARATGDDQFRTAYEWARMSMVPPADAVRLIPWKSPPHKDHLAEYVARYERFKQSRELYDFSDMLENALRLKKTPVELGVRVALYDEAQDCSALLVALARLWAEGCERVVLAGDDDQCLPSDDLVLTPSGARPIRDLRVGDDICASYGRAKGVHAARISCRTEEPYNGNIVVIATRSGRTVRATPSHHVPAAWPQHGGRLGWWYVYLERALDGRYRMGITSNPVQRARLERNMAGLLPVKCVATQEEALGWETILSLRYGIPTALFANRGSEHEMSNEGLRFIWDRIDSASGARRLLSEHGLRWKGAIVPGAVTRGGVARKLVRIDCLRAEKRRRKLDAVFTVTFESRGAPKLRRQTLDLREARRIANEIADRVGGGIYERWHIGSRRSGTMRLTPAGNVHPGMLVALADGSVDEVTNVSLEPYSGTVVDIEVAGCHNFISGSGIVLGNCIYEFNGVSPAWMVDLAREAKVTILRQSHRIPRRVQAVAGPIIRRNKRRVSKRWAPRPEDGTVRRMFLAGAVEEAAKAAAAGRTAMILFRNRVYMRAATSRLTDMAVPFLAEPTGGPFSFERRTKRGAMRLVEAVALAAGFLRDGEVDAGRLSLAIELYVPSEGQKKAKSREAKAWLSDGPRVPHGTKSRLSALDGKVSLADAAAGDLASWVEALQVRGPVLCYSLGIPKRTRERLETFRLRNGGTLPEPKITVSTVHAQKGREASFVAVSPDMTAATWESYQRDEECENRVFYVACTRARDELILCHAETDRAFAWPTMEQTGEALSASVKRTAGGPPSVP